MSLLKLFGLGASEARATSPERVVATETALSNHRSEFSEWHTASAREPSPTAAHASIRLAGDLAVVKADRPARRIAADDLIFTMGSCFARNLEIALLDRGGRVVSIDLEALDQPAFKDEHGDIRLGFFHRYTPQSMLQEFRRAFDEIPGWDDASSLIERYGDGWIDPHFAWLKQGDHSRDQIITRRRVARELTRRAAEAKVLVITLGLTESWRHRPTGLWLNKVSLPHLKRSPGAYELHLTPYEQILSHLEDTLELLRRHHRTGDLRLIVTVSPVPLSATFSGRDVVVANMDSKAALRAAAGAFALRHPELVSYFPSYEIVMHSNPAQAFEVDRAHVSRRAVAAIIDQFLEAYVEGGAAALSSGRLRAGVRAD